MKKGIVVYCLTRVLYTNSPLTKTSMYALGGVVGTWFESYRSNYGDEPCVHNDQTYLGIIRGVSLKSIDMVQHDGKDSRLVLGVRPKTDQREK